MAVDLSDNALTGPLPQLPSTMVELMTLKLQENSLTGTLPGSWGKCCSAQIVFGMALNCPGSQGKSEAVHQVVHYRHTPPTL